MEEKFVVWPINNRDLLNSSCSGKQFSEPSYTNKINIISSEKLNFQRSDFSQQVISDDRFSFAIINANDLFDVSS